MTFKRITVQQEKANRFFCVFLLLSFIPSILLSGHYQFFWLPKQQFSANQQEVISAVIEVTEKYPEVEEITVTLKGFPVTVNVQNGSFSTPQTALYYRILNFILWSIALVFCYFICIFAIYLISKLFIRYEE